MNIAELVQSQRDFFNSGATRPLSYRLSVIKKLGSVIEDKEPEILQSLRTDLGKPEIEAYLSEIYFLKQEIRLVLKELRKWSKPQKVKSPFYHFPERAEIHRDPFGVSLVIAPWNYPFQISLAPLLSSIASGNTVILKPSELAPATSVLLNKLVSSVFAPEHATVVEGNASIGKQLLEQKFDLIFFTGSEPVGKIVAKAAAQTLTPTILELGGKCPVLVDASADPEITAQRIVRGKYFNAGQTCLAADYVVAHADIYDAVLQQVKKCTTDLYGGTSLTGDISSIVNQQHWKRLRGLIDDSLPIGEDNPENLQMAPRIVPLDSNWDHPSMQSEIFGPILPILKYQDETEVVNRINQFPNPLGLYLFSRNRDWVERMMIRIPSGSVGINDVIKQGINLNLPLGGVGNSGMGSYRGKHGFDAFTQPRAVSRRWFSKDTFSIDPPYEGKFEKNRKFLK